MTNLIEVKRQFNTLRDLRQQAYLGVLNARERQEESSTEQNLPDDDSGVIRAAKIYEVFDDALQELRKIIIAEFGAQYLEKLYDL